MATDNVSLFHGVASRELSGFRVRKRPFFGNDSSSIIEAGALAVEHNGDETPPFSISFSKSGNTHILAVSDEDGYVSLYGSRRKITSSASFQENTNKTRLCDWVAHENAIFDVCWTKDDTRILTASGDQTIKLWDVHEQRCVGLLMGHRGSVKSLCMHSSNPELLVSGSRDGSFILWDLRCNSKPQNMHSEPRIIPTATVKKAHVAAYGKWVRRTKAANMSITSVLYLKDEFSIATAGAVDSVLKFWDARNLKSLRATSCPHAGISSKERLHGISSLSQDSNGLFLSASCMDNRIYLYNVLQLDKGPIKSFTGCQIGSFFVKSMISPDAAHILGGSTDGNAYIWQVDTPTLDPIALKGHTGEVTSVNWCPSELGRGGTCSDDFTVRLWNIEDSGSSRKPAAIRRRVTPVRGGRFEGVVRGNASEDMTEPVQPEATTSVASPRQTTPKSEKKSFSFAANLEESVNKSPEFAPKSPSSVLTPPSSGKRTIRDYFVAAS